MTTSGTVGLTQYPVSKIIEQAMRRCGIPTSTINAEMLQVGRDNLFLMLSEWGNRGVSLWRVQQEVIPMTVGVGTYDLPVGSVGLMPGQALFFRARTSSSEIPMCRLNRDDYACLPNKNITGTPVQYWYNRQIRPRITLWPVPNAQAAGGTLTAWVHMQIEDVGTYQNTIDVPQRWVAAVVAGLAAWMMRELPTIDTARLAVLENDAALTLSRAESEETDSAPINIYPDLSPYTR